MMDFLFLSDICSKMVQYVAVRNGHQAAPGSQLAGGPTVSNHCRHVAFPDVLLGCLGGGRKKRKKAWGWKAQKASY